MSGNPDHKALEYGDELYRFAWRYLNRTARSLIEEHGLAAAVTYVLEISRDNGFIRDDLSGAVHYTIVNPRDPRDAFFAQHNARRAQRFAGAGRRVAPKGRVSVNDACFLCLENVHWMQHGLELGIELEVGGTPLVVLPQPYPFAPNHVVAASREHVPQDHMPASDIVRFVASISRLLPTYVVLYNGRAAGASIPGHFHLHAFEPARDAEYPLEVAASRSAQSAAGCRLVERFPVEALAVRPDEPEALELACELAERWMREPGGSLNVMASRAQGLYVVGRDRARARVPGIGGLIGGLELLGEIVFSTPEEKRRLERGDIDYSLIRRTLAGVSMPGFRALAESLLSRC